MRRRAGFEIADQIIAPGQRARIDLPIAGQYTTTPVLLPIQVLHGRRDGPVVWVSAAVHGDEINGVEIIRRLLGMPLLKRLRGTLIAAPIVNVFGFHSRSRYLPDRRDLNRCFPGLTKGTLASRLADTFFSQVVRCANLGIDLHTAAIHRDNLPQVRADLNDPLLARLARGFGAPVLLHSASPAGSLRAAAREIGVPVMSFEAGEALRFDELAIRIGLRGVVNVLRAMEMLPAVRRQPRKTVVLRSSTWVRAGQSGVLRAHVKLGAAVDVNTLLGWIADPFGEALSEVHSRETGVVIGRTNLPLAYEGDALFHIGRTRHADSIEEQVVAAQAEVDDGVPELIEEPPIL